MRAQHSKWMDLRSYVGAEARKLGEMGQKDLAKAS